MCCRTAILMRLCNLFSLSPPPLSPPLSPLSLSLAGIRSWDIDLTACNLNQQLKLFVSRHSATFSDLVKGKEVAGQLLLGASCQAASRGPPEVALTREFRIAELEGTWEVL